MTLQFGNPWKHSIRYAVLGLALVATVGALAACAPAGAASTPQPGSAAVAQPAYADRRILWIDSYHAEYDWSKEVEEGLRSVLDGTGAELKIVRMDTKRNPSDEYGKQAAVSAKAEIDAFQPDVIIASDDPAQKYLIVPYVKDTDAPVVFCCVNWDASGYGYPASNVTGMLEIDLVPQMVELLKPHAKGDRIGYISGDNLTDQKVVKIYNERFFDGQMEAILVKTFDEFKSAYVKMQDEVDILYFGNNAGIEGWDDAQAEDFVTQNARIPSGSRSSWMAPFVLVTVAKLGQEQGEWSAQAALRILDGTPVSDIAVTENKQGKLFLNLKIAEQLGVAFAPSMLRNAEIYGVEAANQ